MFELGKLPFVCRLIRPLIFREPAIAWQDIIPDFAQRRVLLAPIDRVDTFPSAGELYTDLRSVEVSPTHIHFRKPGHYNILTNYGAFKFLILPREEHIDDIVTIARFFSANIVHSGFDVSSCTYGEFTSSMIYYPNLFYKLFFSDQPLGLICCSAALCLCALYGALGYRARRVHLKLPANGHYTVEACDGDRWFIVDPDLDFIARNGAGNLVDVDSLVLEPAETHIESLSGKQISWDLEGQWLRRPQIRNYIERRTDTSPGGYWTFLYGFYGTYTWKKRPATNIKYSEIFAYLLDEPAERITRLTHSQRDGLIASEGWEKEHPALTVREQS